MSEPLSHFCTYFDSNYLVKGLVLYKSLERHAASFRLWVLCLDGLTYEILRQLDLPHIRPISIDEVERGDEALAKVKSNRSQVEYYFTCTPSMILHIFRNHAEVDLITYVDSDLFFFSDPARIYSELADGSALIVGHHFPQHLRELEVFGIYNVGLLSFRRDRSAFECLEWWRERCLEWCYDRVEDGRFADQKYLDDWPTRFKRIIVLQQKGAGLAPWNLANYRLTMKDGKPMVDSDPLIFFHFHQLKKLTGWLYDPGLARFGNHPDAILKQQIYRPYIIETNEVARWIYQRLGSPIKTRPMRGAAKKTLLRRTLKKIKNQVSLGLMLFRGQLLVMIGERIL